MNTYPNQDRWDRALLAGICAAILSAFYGVGQLLGWALASFAPVP